MITVMHSRPRLMSNQEWGKNFMLLLGWSCTLLRFFFVFSCAYYSGQLEFGTKTAALQLRSTVVLLATMCMHFKNASM